MLQRATKRHVRSPLSRHIAAASLEQLRLPWLCPAITNCVEFRRTTSCPRQHTRSAHNRHPAPSLARRPLPSTRHLATDAAAYGSPDDYIPFDGLPPELRRQAYRPSPEGLATLKQFDINELITISPHHHLAPPVVRGNSSRLTGDTAVLQENLYALIRVGRFEQAANIVRSFAQIFQPDAPELVDAHHRYLTGKLEDLLERPSRDKFEDMNRWFELEIRGKSVVPNSGILAIMIKAVMAVLEGGRLDRSIRRYIGIADIYGPEFKEDVVSSSLFLDNEFSYVTRLFPNDFHNDYRIAEDDLPTVFPVESSAQAMLKHQDHLRTKLSYPPELKPVEQKGLGLKALKSSLKSMAHGTNVLATEDMERDPVQTDDRWRQIHLERAVLDSALARWREESENTQAIRARGQIIDPLLGSYAFDWIQEMVPLVNEEIRFSKTANEHEITPKDTDRILLGPHLERVSPDKLCAAAVLAYIRHINDKKNNESAERSIVTTVARMGTDIAKEIEYQQSQDVLLQTSHTEASPALKQKLSKLSKKQKSSTRSKAMSKVLERDLPPATENSLHPDLRAKLGAMFLTFLMKVAKLPVTKVDPSTGLKVTESQFVITHSWKWKAGKRIGVVQTNPEFITRLSREPVGTFIAKFLPMVIQPRPWKTLHEGPFLETDVPAVRFRDTSRSQQEYVAMATKRGDMKQTYAALDVIGKVPWRVNRDVFKVLTDAWNSGEAIGGLAPENPTETWPEKPPASDIKAMIRWKALVKEQQNTLTGLHSQRCYQNFQLEVARSYLNETFYCPHNVDFRGRAYPIPPYFNHIGADYVRGLFMFAQGKPLGTVGLKWLKIHVANVYGYDKASLAERELFADEHLEEIRDAARNPLEGRRWWLTSDDPWQTLAACMELTNALDSADPSEFVSHLPVQQDGTCNGLQHYAALGGDVIGAKQVNLMPGSKPADIYSGVADMVKKDVSEAAARGEKAAIILDGKITRKVVKQPVMTNVYGVTFHGATAQVRKQLVDILPKESLDNDIHLGHLSKYIAVLIFKALSRMFVGAHAIQSWLGECGARISSAVTPEQIERIKAHRAGELESPFRLKRKQTPSRQRAAAKEDYQFKSTIVWTTPLGMPVVQPYREPKFKTIRTSLQDIAVLDASVSDPVSKRKQLQGFPPNFIHSLDATHMMLSALKCDEVGLQFSSVHDSFWTHAADVPVMNRILRDAFIRMHSEDVIGRLREEFLARYRGCMRYAPIDAKSPLGQKIISLRKSKGTHSNVFSRGTVKEGAQVDELLEEYERLKLLKSDDAEDNIKGREMVTPASLFEADSQGGNFLSSSNDEIPLLGELDTDDSGHVLNVNDDVEVPGLDIPPVLQQEVPASAEVPNKDAEMEARPEVLEKKAKNKRTPKVFLWLPIDFPSAPQKGEFNVASLGDSQYFFS